MHNYWCRGYAPYLNQVFCVLSEQNNNRLFGNTSSGGLFTVESPGAYVVTGLAQDSSIQLYQDNHVRLVSKPPQYQGSLVATLTNGSIVSLSPGESWNPTRYFLRNPHNFIGSTQVCFQPQF